MTHSEQRTAWWKEGLITLGTGFLYGGTSVLVGHPFDTIKTKMQVQTGFENRTMMRSFVKTVKDLGLRGLYRGWVPPFCGSIIFRSSQFAVFEAVYTYLDSPFARYEIPLTGGIQLRLIAGAVGAGTVRAVIETPLEYAKVRRQIQKTWKLRDLHRGFVLTWSRTVGLWCTYIILFDSLTEAFSTDTLQFCTRSILNAGSSDHYWLVDGLAARVHEIPGPGRRETEAVSLSENEDYRERERWILWSISWYCSRVIEEFRCQWYQYDCNDHSSKKSFRMGTKKIADFINMH